MKAAVSSILRRALWVARCGSASWPRVSQLFVEPGARRWIGLTGQRAGALAALGIERSSCAVAFVVDLKRCVDHINIEYTSAHSHYFVETAKALLANEGLDPLSTPFASFVQAFQPLTLRDVFFDTARAPATVETLGRFPARFFANGMPWSTDRRLQLVLTSSPPAAPIHFGPVPTSLVVQEVGRLHSVASSFVRHGYEPTWYPDGFIRGFLLRSGRDYRFVVTSGKHRMAMLEMTGHVRLDVVFEPHDFVSIVDIEEVESWPQVESGLYSGREARVLFETYFAGTDAQAHRLRLATSSARLAVGEGQL